MTPEQSATLNRISKERTGLNFSEMISRGNISVSTVDTIMEKYTDEILNVGKVGFYQLLANHEEEVLNLKNKIEEIRTEGKTYSVPVENITLIAPDKKEVTKKAIVKPLAPKKTVKKSNKK